MSNYVPPVALSRVNSPGMVRRPPSRAFGLLFGLGLGGSVDCIVLHQMLQWHHMVSDVRRYPVTTIAGLEINTLADGLFHAASGFLSWPVPSPQSSLQKAGLRALERRHSVRADRWSA
jgi:hypothetical protein